MTKHVLKPWVAVLAVVAVVALAGCESGTAPPDGSGGASLVAATAAASPTVGNAAANKAATQAEAERLVKLAVIPPSAVGTQTPPITSSAPLAYPALGLPNAESLVEVNRMWRVNLSFDQTRAWLAAHPPPGLRASASAIPDSNSARVAGIGYQAPDSTAWVNAELQISTAGLSPTTSLIRVDGEALWLDPKPYRDTEPGRRLRVEARGSCPRSDQHAIGVTNTGAELKAVLVPPITPTSGLICRFDGLNGHPFALTRSTPLDPATAGRIATAVQRIRLSHPLSGPHGCPMDDAATTVIALTYPGRPDVDLWYHRTGCSGVANGFIQAGAGDLGQAVTAAEGPTLSR